MKPVVRKGDTCTGHGCFPSRANVEGSDFVTIEDIPVHCVGHAWATHCCGPACHDSVQGSGADYISIEGSPVARVGDDVACGSKNATGSDFVFAE